MNLEMSNALGALEQTARLLSIFSVIQGIEFLMIQSAVRDNGIWRQADLRLDFPTFHFWLRPEFFLVLNLVRLFVAFLMLLMPSAPGLCVLLVCHVLTLLRWRGTFNGGSDSMFLYVLSGATLGLFYQEDAIAPKVALWFISLNLVYSYLRAGLLKLIQAPWRNGNALRTFLTSSQYQPSLFIQRFCNSSFRSLGAWILMLFEISFPLALIGPIWAITFVSVGICFHLANAYAFSLNRFLFAWICAYPALLYCASA